MTNQSELESDIEMLLLRVYNGEYDRSASQTLADVKKRIVSLITAYYTPNSEVADKVNTAVATRELELDHQWSKELERAVLRGKIEMLKRLKAEFCEVDEDTWIAEWVDAELKKLEEN